MCIPVPVPSNWKIFLLDFIGRTCFFFMFLISLWVVKYRYKCVYGRYDTNIWLDIGIQSYEAATGATLQSQSLFNNMSLEMFPFLATRRQTTALSTTLIRIFVLCRKFTTTSRGMFPYLATRRPTTPLSTTLSTTATSAATRIFGLHLLQTPR